MEQQVWGPSTDGNNIKVKPTEKINGGNLSRNELNASYLLFKKTWMKFKETAKAHSLARAEIAHCHVKGDQEEREPRNTDHPGLRRVGVVLRLHLNECRKPTENKENKRGGRWREKLL